MEILDGQIGSITPDGHPPAPAPPAEGQATVDMKPQHPRLPPEAGDASSHEPSPPGVVWPGDAQQIDGTGCTATLSLESRWPERPRGREGKQRTSEGSIPPRHGGESQFALKIARGRERDCHGGEQLQGRRLPATRQLGSPFPLDVACPRRVSLQILGLEQPRTLELSGRTKDKCFNMC